MRLFHSSLFALWTLSVMACGREAKVAPATAVVVSVDTDIPAIASLRVTILDGSGTKPGGTGTYPVDRDKAQFPFSFTVAPPSDATTGRFSVRVEGLNARDVVLASVQAQGTFTSQRTRLMTLWLAKLCQGVSCDDGQTCHYEEGDAKAGMCGDLLAPKLTDFESGADGDMSRFPTLAAPMETSMRSDPTVSADDTETSTADGRQAGPDGGTGNGDAGPLPPPVPNLPTVGSFRSLGARRGNADNSLIVFEDGFEESGRICNPDGMCAVVGFTP